MKRQPRALKLNTTTIRTLQDNALAMVQGGNIVRYTQASCAATCSETCSCFESNDTVGGNKSYCF